MASETWEQDKINMLLLSNEEAHKVTRESIELALVYLMKEEAFEKISVSEIVKRAGVSRAAFYKNYKSKEEVLRSYIYQLTEDFGVKMQEAIDQEGQFWKTMFENLLEYQDTYLTICDSGLKSFLMECFNDTSMKYMNALDDQNRYYMLFYSGAVTNVIIEWLSSGARETPQEMGRIMEEMIG